MECGHIIVNLKECPVPSISAVGEELVTTEDWIKAHKEGVGAELNLFDEA